MKLTKDECVILADILDEHKYEFSSKFSDLKPFDSLERLQERLQEAGKDHRRVGRKSQNYFTDIMKRFIKNSK